MSEQSLERSAAGVRVPGGTTFHRVGTRNSNCLLIINKGPGAVKVAREGAAWDLLEILFAQEDIAAIEEDPQASDADFVVFETDRRMRKFAIVKRVFELCPVLGEYDVVMMLDDDLLPVNCTIGDIFAAFIEAGFRVGQPALSEDSFWSHEIVVQNKAFRWRRTNFVEVMCPIMTMPALREYLAMFDATVSGFGLDNYWSTREWKDHGGLVILDGTPMRHTRPVGGGVAYQGLSASVERRAFFAAYKLKNYRHLTLGGMTSGANARLCDRRISYRSQVGDIAKFQLRRILERLLFHARSVRSLAVRWGFGQRRR